MDFEVPVYMTKEQRSKFEDFMKKEFGEENVKFSNVYELDKKSSEHETGKWGLEDYFYLATCQYNKIGKKDMAVRMKIASFRPPFIKWLNETRRETITMDTIKEFIEIYSGGRHGKR